MNMKIQSIYLLLQAALLLLLASCNQEETGGVTPLPDGKYPLQLTAELAQPQTRAGGKDTWTGGDEIGVLLGEMPDAKKYVMDASGKTQPADAENTIYWQSTAEASVQAWYPYQINPYVDIADQSGGYAAFDFLYATTRGRYDQEIYLRFNHRMAKIEFTLAAGEGIAEEEVDGATVNIYGVQEVNFINGTVQPVEGSYGEIELYHDAAAKKFEAVVVPQDMTGKPFIRIGIGGRTFAYTPETEAVGKLEAGKRYAYTITVKANGIDVQAMTGGTWNTAGEENVAVVKPIVYTADEVKAGDYIYSDGTTSDGGLRKRYTDGRAPVIASPKPQPIAGKNVVGVVFWTPKDTDPTGRKTPASLTDDKVMAKDFPNCTHGLAVSKVTHQILVGYQKAYEHISVNFQDSENFNPANKADYVSIRSSTMYFDPINRILGYQNTKVMRAYNEFYKNTSNRIVKPIAELENLTASNPAPKNSTGWFLPSVKELHILCYKDVDDIKRHYNYTYSQAENWNYIVNPSLDAAGSQRIRTTAYWSSTEGYYNDALAYIMLFPGATQRLSHKWEYEVEVLAVCAF